MPILVVIPVQNSAKVLADMTNQLIQFTEMFGRARVVLTFGIGDSKDDDTYFQISQTVEALQSSNILNRVQFPKDLDEWTQRTLFEYMNDFPIAVILRGVVCAIDLVRLVIHAVENDADLACAVDIQFDRNHRIITTSLSRDLIDNKPISTDDLLLASTFVQARSCDASVKVLSFKGIRSSYPCHLRDIISDHRPSGQNCQSSVKIMISTSVKASPDPEDFRSAIQLGFMDMHGFDYRPLEWEERPS